MSRFEVVVFFVAAVAAVANSLAFPAGQYCGNKMMPDVMEMLYFAPGAASSFYWSALAPMWEPTICQKETFSYDKMTGVFTLPHVKESSDCMGQFLRNLNLTAAVLFYDQVTNIVTGMSDNMMPFPFYPCRQPETLNQTFIWKKKNTTTPHDIFISFTFHGSDERADFSIGIGFGPYRSCSNEPFKFDRMSAQVTLPGITKAGDCVADALTQMWGVSIVRMYYCPACKKLAVCFDQSSPYTDDRCLLMS